MSTGLIPYGVSMDDLMTRVPRKKKKKRLPMLPGGQMVAGSFAPAGGSRLRPLAGARGLPESLPTNTAIAANRTPLPGSAPIPSAVQEPDVRHEALMGILRGNTAAMRGRRRPPLPALFSTGEVAGGLPRPGANRVAGLDRIIGRPAVRDPNAILAEQMQAGGREAQVDQPVMSTLQRTIDGVLQPPKSLGRFSEPFAGSSLAAYTAKAKAYKEALAAGEPAEHPGAFRREWSPGQPEYGEALAQEDVARSRRLARRGGMPTMAERRTRVGLRAQGLPFTGEDARIEQALAGGEELTPGQEMHRYGEGVVPRQLADAQARMKERELEAAREGSMIAADTATVQNADAPASSRRAAQKRLDAMRAGGGLAASGGGRGPGGAEGPSELATEIEEIGDMQAEMPEYVADDPLEADRWLGAQGFSRTAIDQWGPRRYGNAAWNNRKSFARGLPVIGRGTRIGERLEEAGWGAPIRNFLGGLLNR